MYYLGKRVWKIWIGLPIPIPDKWWTKHLMGATWLTEALVEITLAKYYLNQFNFQAIGWLWIPVSVSTWFACIVGAIHFSLGNVQWFQEWQVNIENRDWKGVFLILLSLSILLAITIVITSK